MKKVLFLCLVLVLFVGVSQAASINWWGNNRNAYDNVGMEAWISQAGSSVLAVNASASANATLTKAGIVWENADAAEMLAGVTQNDVTFTGVGVLNDLSEDTLAVYGNFERRGLPGNDDAFYDGGAYNLDSFTLSGLTVGASYKLQIMGVDNRGADSQYGAGFGDGTQDADASQAAGTLGWFELRRAHDEVMYAIGTFTADSDTITIDVAGTQDDYATFDRPDKGQFNALQLREVPEPATMALLGLGSLLAIRRRKA